MSLRNQRRLLACCLVLFLFPVSCATTDLTTRATKVRLIPAEQFGEVEDQCEFIGNVIGRSYWVFSAKAAHHNALNELLDNAAEIGATHLFVNRGNFRHLLGEAFFCAHCLDKNGKPDVGHCVDKSGNPVDIQAMGPCKTDGHTWVPPVKDQIACEAKEGQWVPNSGVFRKIDKKSAQKQ